MSRRSGSPFVAYRIAAVLVLVAFYVASFLGGSGSAVAVAAIGIPLIFLFGNYSNPNREPWAKVLGNVGMLFLFAAVLIAGFTALDGYLDGWASAVAVFVWGALLLGVFLYILWRLEGVRRDRS